MSNDREVEFFKEFEIPKRKVYYECSYGRSGGRCCPDMAGQCKECQNGSAMKPVYKYPEITAEQLFEILRIKDKYLGVKYSFENCVNYAEVKSRILFDAITLLSPFNSQRAEYKKEIQQVFNV